LRLSCSPLCFIDGNVDVAPLLHPFYGRHYRSAEVPLSDKGQRKMAGRSGLKASQRGRVAAVSRAVSAAPVRVPDEPVRWKERRGTYQRDVGDGEHSEVQIGERVYRVKTSELIFGAASAAPKGAS
jgi:hypothetical protein